MKSLYIMLIIGLGSFIGGMARYLTVITMNLVFNASSSLAIIIVNVLGSFFIGFFSELLASNLNFAFKFFLISGILGGFTTFSTFSLDIVNLLSKKYITLGVLYLTASILLSLLAVIAGMKLAQKI